MTTHASARVRETIFSILADRNLPPVGEDEALFSTGRLDSLAAAEVLMVLEEEYGVDLSDEDFDIGRIDTLRDLEAFVASTGTVQPAA